VSDAPNRPPILVAIAMNGWDEGQPAWWRNLEAHPDAVIRLPHEPLPVRARPSVGDERERLWKRWVSVDPRVDAYAARRSTDTPVIVLEPRSRQSGPVVRTRAASRCGVHMCRSPDVPNTV
jgi:deazaflavin-dependent oxidoreductase (nitroreductase family)